MPVDPPALSTPPVSPDPGVSTPRSPAGHSEAVLRDTFLAQFANPAGREALHRFGGLLYTATLSAGHVGNPGRLIAADDLDAVADDLDALAVALQAIAEVPDPLVLGSESQDLRRQVRDWKGRLIDLPTRFGARCGKRKGSRRWDTDRPLAADIREADRIADRVARRLGDHHPDPEVRRICRQLVEHVESKREGQP